MKNAAMVLGIIGGVVGMVVGFFGYGFAEVGSWFSDATNGLTDEALGTGENADRSRFVGLFAPILSIAGGAMSPGEVVAPTGRGGPERATMPAAIPNANSVSTRCVRRTAGPPARSQRRRHQDPRSPAGVPAAH